MIDRWPYEPDQRIVPGCYVQHIPTGKVRRVSGMRGNTVHFFQGVRGLRDGKPVTVYWASADKCLRVSQAA